jgi:hypothetical protein
MYLSEFIMSKTLMCLITFVVQAGHHTQTSASLSVFFCVCLVLFVDWYLLFWVFSGHLSRTVLHLWNKVAQDRLHYYILPLITSYKTVRSQHGMPNAVLQTCKFVWFEVTLWLRVQTTSVLCSKSFHNLTYCWFEEPWTPGISLLNLLNHFSYDLFVYPFY